MAYKLLNRATMSVSGTPGTGDVTLGSAATGQQSFSAAGAANGDTFPYVMEDGSAWEFGVATYNSSGPTVSRTTVTQSSAGGTTKISATSSATIYCSILGGSIPLANLSDVVVSSPLDGQVFTYETSSGKWKNKTLPGGISVGTPPTVVQFGSVSVNSTVPSVVLGSAPVSGNLLVAMMYSDGGAQPTTASGWTLVSSAASGVWWNFLFTKVAGAGESATQSPVTGGSSSHWAIGIWEVNGQNVTSPLILGANVNAIASSSLALSLLIPQSPSTLYLASLIASTVAVSFTSAISIATVDANLTSAAGGRPLFGHSDSNTQIYCMGGVMSTASLSNYAVAFVTH